MRLPVWFNAEITQGEITRILRDAGLHMKSEGHRLVVDRVPHWLTKAREQEEEEARHVVLPMPRRKRA